MPALRFTCGAPLKKLWLATKASVEALPKIERAYVFVEVRLEERLFHSPSGQATGQVSIYVWNHGKTPAILKKLRGYVDLLADTPQQLLPLPGGERELPPGLVIRGGDYRIEKFSYRLSDSDMGDIDGGQRVLYCLGRIEYQAVLGVHCETGFCWRYRPSSLLRDFVISPDTNLNFHS